MQPKVDAYKLCRIDATDHLIVLGRAAKNGLQGFLHGKATKEEIEALLDQLERAVQSRSSTTIENLLALQADNRAVSTGYEIEPEEAERLLPILRDYLGKVENGTEPQFEDDPPTFVHFPLN